MLQSKNIPSDMPHSEVLPIKLKMSWYQPLVDLSNTMSAISTKVVFSSKNSNDQMFIDSKGKTIELKGKMHSQKIETESDWEDHFFEREEELSEETEPLLGSHRSTLKEYGSLSPELIKEFYKLL